MPGVHRAADLTTGHGCPPGGACGGAPPTVAASFSPDVRVNGWPVVRNGDGIVPHCCSCPDCPGPGPCPPHGGSYGGSHTVFANGRDVQVIGDPISCSGAAASGSGNVFVEG